MSGGKVINRFALAGERETINHRSFGCLVLFGRQRRGPGGRGPFAGTDVRGTALFVFSRGQPFQFGFPPLDRLVIDLLEEGNAPAATCPGPAAFG